MTTNELAGCVALVTGASSGIGEATARSLAGLGAAVVLVARREDRLEQLAEQIRDGGGDALPVLADVTDEQQAQSAVKRAIGAYGRLDILINNAGVLSMGPVADAPTEQWQQMLETNVEGLVFVTQAALPHLVEAAQTSSRRMSDLVNIGSTSAHTQRAGTAMYSLTKAGISAFTESLRQEMVPASVRVSLVEPGTVATDLIAPPKASPPPGPSQTSGVELLQAQDVADVICYVVTRPRRVALNRILLRAGEQTW
jgi:NADP-dependent 3-hydroxy acid dehydrogenase YdfG